MLEQCALKAQHTECTCSNWNWMDFFSLLISLPTCGSKFSQMLVSLTTAFFQGKECWIWVQVLLYSSPHGSSFFHCCPGFSHCCHHPWLLHLNCFMSLCWRNGALELRGLILVLFCHEIWHLAASFNWWERMDRPFLSAFQQVPH